MRILSFDVGGSKIFSAVVDENGNLLTELKSFATPKGVQEIVKIFAQCCSENMYDAVAIATAGIIKDNHLSGKPNNLPQGYENIKFADIFQKPYTLENDANAAVWAEFKLGNLRGVQHGVMLTLGTDVGCGIICNGVLLHGKNGAAGEVQMNFSGTGLQKIADRRGLKERDCFKIYEQVKEGKTLAHQVYAEWEEELIDGLQQINRILDTECFVLSGSLAEIVDYAKVNTMLKLLDKDNAPLIKRAFFGAGAGLFGAARLCYERNFERKA